MRRLVIFLILLLGFVGCGSPGYVKVEPIAGVVKRLVVRHNAYVSKDKTLTDLRRRVYKRDGVLLLRLLDEAQGKVK